MQTVLQVSNMILETDTIIGKFTNRVEIAQINAVKMSQCMDKIIMGIYKIFTLDNSLIA